MYRLRLTTQILMASKFIRNYFSDYESIAEIRPNKKNCV